jgi:2-keto-3-deoxy-L-rhamnonate aldolase RhmA
MIDHEHGAFDIETIADLAGWFQATNVSAIVRIHKSFTHLVPEILDQGIMGIHCGIAGARMHTGYRRYGARHATEYAPGAMIKSSSAYRSNRSRAWRMSRRSRPWRAST